MAHDKFDKILKQFSTIIQKPSVQNDMKSDIKGLVKNMYDYTKVQEKVKHKKQPKYALSTLIIDDFDEEQIWQEIELQNSERWDQFISEVTKCITVKKDLIFPLEEHKEKPVINEVVHEDVKNKSNSKLKNKSTKGKKQLKSSVVDDEFFKLDEMKQFLLKEDKKEFSNHKKNKSDSEEESVNMFEDIDDEDGDMSDDHGDKQDMMYSDFFGQEDNNGEFQDNTEAMESDIEDNGSANEGSDKTDETDAEMEVNDKSAFDSDKTVMTVSTKPSEFQLRQQRLNEKISKLENKTLGAKPWQMQGEVDALSRPQNSLLQEVVDFDMTTRPPPTITEKSTVTLEEIIKKRITDKAWDDVEKKIKPVEDMHTFKKTEVLDHAKSQMSLAQVYEAEYLKQQRNLNEDKDEAQAEPENHVQIRSALKNLFSKLDALSHSHYTPKPAQPEIKIISNAPAISMEEVVPVTVSDATLLAPEEIKAKRSGELMSKSERSTTDKKRERRKKKKLQREKAQQQTNNNVPTEIKRKKIVSK